MTADDQTDLEAATVLADQLASLIASGDEVSLRVVLVALGQLSAFSLVEMGASDAGIALWVDVVMKQIEVYRCEHVH